MDHPLWLVHGPLAGWLSDGWLMGPYYGLWLALSTYDTTVLDYRMIYGIPYYTAGVWLGGPRLLDGLVHRSVLAPSSPGSTRYIPIGLMAGLDGLESVLGGRLDGWGGVRNRTPLLAKRASSRLLLVHPLWTLFLIFRTLLPTTPSGPGLLSPLRARAYILRWKPVCKGLAKDYLQIS